MGIFSSLMMAVRSVLLVLVVVVACVARAYPTPSKNLPHFDNVPEGVIFFGHYPAPDTDTVAAAMGGAELWGGVAAIPCALPRESLAALAYFNLTSPPLLSDIYNGTQKLCTVDFNDRAQLHPIVKDLNNVVCIVDHHATNGMVPLPMPSTVDIRPWGSASTVFAFKFWEHGKVIPAGVAGMLLAGLISDTLFLGSPTTTDADKYAIDRLAALAHVKNTTDLAYTMFLARSNYSGMTPQQILLSDYKEFTLGDFQIGFGSADTVDLTYLLSLQANMTAAMKALKADHKLDYLFFAPINMLTHQSFVYILDAPEGKLAQKAFGKPVVNGMVDSTPLVSRKDQFIPALQKALDAAYEF